MDYLTHLDYLFYIGSGFTAILLIVAIILIVRSYMSRLVDKRIAIYQNDLITKQCDEVQNIYKQMRGWRHDYHNHIQTMKAHLSLNQVSELDEYLGELDADLTSVDTVIKTGNVMVDAILNSKISLAASKKININTKATVPEKLRISEIDLCVIIGNLLDNATEACLKIENEADRFIRVYISIMKEQLYISVSNSVGGEVKKEGKFYHSTKVTTATSASTATKTTISAKGSSHGFGLMRVDKIAEKYNGYINRQNEEGVFATEIMLPL